MTASARPTAVWKLLVGAVVLLTSVGCSWDGVNSLSLPGGAGQGDDAIDISVEMPDVTTITVNSPVLVNDVKVGRITGISLRGWHAQIDIALNADVQLPANAVAAIGQTSLLGSQHIELAPPDAPGEGRLQDGAVIPMTRATEYPTTERTLSSLSVLLNGGGLAQLGTIVRGVNDALDSNVGVTRDLITRLSNLTATLNGRRETIVDALEGLDRLAATVNAQNPVLDQAIRDIQPAVAELSQRRGRLSEVLTELDRFGSTAGRVIETSADDIEANIANLHPTLKSLADSGNSLVNSLDLAFTMPFPVSKIDRVVRGDYANLFVILDFSVPRLRSDLLRGTPLGRTLSGPGGVLGQNPATAGDSGNPLTRPLEALIPAPDGGR